MNLLSSAEFIDNVNDYLVNIGLDGAFGQVFLAFMIIVGATIILSLLQVPKIMILMVAVIATLMFATFLWFPLWVVILLGVGVFVFFLFSILGGATA